MNAIQAQTCNQNMDNKEEQRMKQSSQTNNPNNNMNAQSTKLFAHLTSFRPYELQKINTPKKIHLTNRFNLPLGNTTTVPLCASNGIVKSVMSSSEISSPAPPINSIITNNNSKLSQPSFFKIAKDFCDNVKNKAKVNIDMGMDEITKRMASLQLGIPKVFFTSHNIKSNLSKFGSLMDICSGF